MKNNKVTAVKNPEKIWLGIRIELSFKLSHLFFRWAKYELSRGDAKRERRIKKLKNE